VLLFVAALAAFCAPAHALRVAWNVDIHQGKFLDPNYANDFHIWGVLESWNVPTITNKVNFQTTGPGGIPPWQIIPVGSGGKWFENFGSRITDQPALLVPPARPLPPGAPPINLGGPFYYFDANWKTAGQIPFCTWMHFGLEFEEAGKNIGYWLRGVWTKDGVDPEGQPLYGFEVVHTAGGGGGGGRIRIQNASGVETEILQMDLMVLHGAQGQDFRLEDLNTDFFRIHASEYQWASVPSALLPQKMLAGDGQSVDSFFDVFFDLVPGLGPMADGDVLLARQHSSYVESTGDPDFWQYELHGVPEPATLSLLALGGLALLRRKRKS
jgi:hypothetical protein